MFILLLRTRLLTILHHSSTMTLNKFINTLNVTQMRLPATILVPTFPDKKDEEELDLQSLTEEDLKLLKKTGMHSCCFCYLIPIQ